MMAVMTLITKMKNRVMTPKVIIQDLGGATVVARVVTPATTTIRAAMMAVVMIVAAMTTIRAAAVATPAQAATTLAKVITMMIKDLGQKLAINFLKPGRCDRQTKGVLDDLASLTAGGPVLVSI